jgi:hypothetical protein
MLAAVTDWVSAIGSLAAIAAALYIAVRSQRRTRISLEFDRHRGDLKQVDFRDNGAPTQEIWLRIRLRNRGRSLAESAQVFPTIVRSNGEYDLRSSKWLKVSGLALSKAPIPPGADRYYDVGFVWSALDGRSAMALLRVGETPGDWDQERESAKTNDALASDVLHEIFVLGTCANSAAKYGCLKVRFDTKRGLDPSAVSCALERMTRRKYIQATSNSRGLD